MGRLVERGSLFIDFKCDFVGWSGIFFVAFSVNAQNNALNRKESGLKKSDKKDAIHCIDRPGIA
jgi:hypothetical protein